MGFIKRNWLSVLVYIGATLPLVVLIWNFSRNELTANPIREVQLLTGRDAITLLALTLAVTPVSRILRSGQLLRQRRTLGLFTFFYVCLHFINFVAIDYGFNFVWIYQDLFEKPYAVVGFASFVLMLPLAVTSTRGWMVRLGRNWRRLHMLIYPAAGLAAIHYLWQVKSHPQAPVWYGILLIVLLLLRLPVMKKLTARFNRQPAEDADPGF